jgi:hypothetical protein
VKHLGPGAIGDCALGVAVLLVNALPFAEARWGTRTAVVDGETPVISAGWRWFHRDFMGMMILLGMLYNYIYIYIYLYIFI